MFLRFGLGLIIVSVIGLLAACATTGDPADAAEAASTSATATWPYGASAAQTLADQLAAESSWPLPEIQAANQAFRDFDRTQVNREDLFELKFALLQWHWRVRKALLQEFNQAAQAGQTERLPELINRLAALQMAPEAADLTRIIEAVKAMAAQKKPLTGLAEAIGAWLELAGNAPLHNEQQQKLNGAGLAGVPAASLRDGPALIPAIKPSRESEWGWQRILDEAKLADYFRNDQGQVVFRGQCFVPGDILLVNLANPSEGIFTFFSAESNYSYHLALYAEIVWQGRRVPCVYESFEHGTRIVPLVTYLTPEHSICVEVYRWRQPQPDAATRISSAILQELRRAHGFDLSLSDNEAASAGGRYITCTTTVGNILKVAGYPLPAVLSALHPQILPNLRRLKVSSSQFLTPTDFAYMPELQPVAFIDNCQLELYAAAAITITRVGRLFQSGVIHPELDGDWPTYVWGVDQVHSHGFFGPMLLGIFGFTDDNFPSGPRELLGVALRLEEEVDKAVDPLRQKIAARPERYLAGTCFSIHGLTRDPRLESTLQQTLKTVGSWFTAN